MFVCAYTRNGWNSDRFQALERPKDVTEWRTVPNLAALLCSTNGWAISNTNYSFTQTLLQALPMRFTQEKKRHKCVKITHRICYMSIPMSTGVAGSNPDSGSPPTSASTSPISLTFSATLQRGFTFVYLFPILPPMGPACPTPTPTTTVLVDVVSPSKYSCLEVHLSRLLSPSPVLRPFLLDSDPRWQANLLDLVVTLHGSARSALQIP
ncbi:hypothetical protein EDD16DRAFT_1711387 [Pisolithus croceorrhizus]|nr:hypothetical protein EDD16DRAFT_1711387 [Pisolithus croceorrhizus]